MLDKDLDPDDYDDYDEFMDDCMSEGVDEDTCEIIWDNKAMKQPSSENGSIIKVSVKETKANSDGMEFILSDDSVDRYDDIIEVDGWQLDNFNANPIALFGHSSNFPIGTWKNVGVRDGALRGTLVMAPEGTSERIDELRRLIDAKILKAVSVGFMPMETNRIEGTFGYRYIKQELMECSLVSVPANPNALAVAKGLRISDDTLRMAFGKQAKKSHVERIIAHDPTVTLWAGKPVEKDDPINWQGHLIPRRPR